MLKYCCKCYIYDPKEHDNIPFEDLPEDWKCPLSGSGKDHFQIVHSKGEKITSPEVQEQHIPTIKIDDNKIIVKIGKTNHPMTKEHYIEDIMLYNNDILLAKKLLKPYCVSEVVFENIAIRDNLKAVISCNLHGLWESEEKL